MRNNTILTRLVTKNVQPETFILLRFSLTLLLLIPIISCSEQNLSDFKNNDETAVLDKFEVESADLSEQLTYKEHHLSSLMEEVNRVNPEFAKLEGFKSGKGDSPAYYIEALLNDNGLLAKNEEHPSLEAFKDLNGEDWYPIISQVREGNSAEAIYVIKSYDEELEAEYIKAYQFDDAGNLSLFDENYTEEDYSTSTNRGDTSTIFALDLAQCKPIYANEKGLYSDCNSGGGGSGTSITNILKIHQIEIRDKKESWIEKADITFIGIKIRFDETENRYKRTSETGKWRGIATSVTKISNSELNEFTTINYELSVENQQIVGLFSLFEWDSWPAPLRLLTTTLLPEPCDCTSPGQLRFEYRSYQSPYYYRLFSFTNAPNRTATPAFGNTFWAIEDNFSARMRFSPYQ